MGLTRGGVGPGARSSQDDPRLEERPRGLSKAHLTSDFEFATLNKGPNRGCEMSAFHPVDVDFEPNGSNVSSEVAQLAKVDEILFSPNFGFSPVRPFSLYRRRSSRGRCFPSSGMLRG